ncbi:hypothetical protein QQF64_003344 [Cirrhinus molitorella]|uniref:Uncharacterized protein n=1 Tax=Cirrhinus molitorella TaxID=172907 RepID=A0ABR3ML19_9TELE
MQLWTPMTRENKEEAACGASIPGHLQPARAVPRVSRGCAWLAVADGRDTQDLKRADEQVRISARLLPGNATLGGFCSPQSVSPRRRCYLRRDVMLVTSQQRRATGGGEAACDPLSPSAESVLIAQILSCRKRQQDEPERHPD